MDAWHLPAIVQSSLSLEVSVPVPSIKPHPPVCTVPIAARFNSKNNIWSLVISPRDFVDFLVASSFGINALFCLLIHIFPVLIPPALYLNMKCSPFSKNSHAFHTSALGKGYFLSLKCSSQTPKLAFFRIFMMHLTSPKATVTSPDEVNCLHPCLYSALSSPCLSTSRWYFNRSYIQSYLILSIFDLLL